MKLKKLVSAGLVAVMATSLLAGCGGSKDSSETADGKKTFLFLSLQMIMSQLYTKA